MKYKFNYLFLLLISLCFLSASAEIKLPALVGDNMVLQRNIGIPVWGWANAGEKISIEFKGKVYKAVAGGDGKWFVKLKPSEAGGPYTMSIGGSNSNKISIRNILVGDVWICSGQSNMAFKMGAVQQLYAKEIADSQNDHIRQVFVNLKYSALPLADVVAAGWKAAGPQNVLSFTAVGYFFARKLYEKYKIPVGLINTSWGGTPAESWTSEDALKPFPQFNDVISFIKDTAQFNNKIETNKRGIADWTKRTDTEDKGYAGGKPVWALGDIDAEWKIAAMPQFWDHYGYRNTYGVFWFRKEVVIPGKTTGKDAVLRLSYLDDEDEVFFNGKKVGGLTNKWLLREYKIPGELIRPGKNRIAVRIKNYNGTGGMAPHGPLELVSGSEVFSLKGDWHYRIGMTIAAKPDIYYPNVLPTTLYNAMIAPLIPYAIKGVIWYQGESNSTRADEYSKLFPAMIKDWRGRWKQGNFPFIYMQLVNYRSPNTSPVESSWAELREAQLKTLSVPNTGMAVGIDIGEANDIHPLNKKDVGYRMALQAERIAYGNKKIIASGPEYRGMKVSGNKITLSFETYGSALAARGGGALKHFAIAGADKKFVWADAVIKDNTIEVSNNAVADPVAVRYAWADNPEGCNLVNAEGLPASPFRTDSWSDPAK